MNRSSLTISVIEMLIRNRRWWVVPVCILVFFTGIKGADPGSGYKKMQEEANLLWEAGKTAEAVDRLSRALKEFPEKTYPITANLMALCLEIDDHDKLFEIWEYGLKRGYFYHIHARGARLKILKNRREFRRLAEENRRLRALAQENNQPLLEVRMPDNYIKGKKYPVLIVLHGYGRSNETMKPWYRSPVIYREYILAFFQSSRIIGTQAYFWQVGPESRKDIGACYRQMVRQYPVDVSKVVIGGMSAGAAAALDAVLHQTIPVRGFILNCPAINRQPGETLLRSAADSGIRGTIITGKKDHGFAGQENLARGFQQVGLAHRFIVNPHLGHNFPGDFPKQLDIALAHIFVQPD